MDGYRPAVWRDGSTDVGVAPGTIAIEYERVVLNRSIESENVFAGKRTKAMDEAWAELIKRMYLFIFSFAKLSLLSFITCTVTYFVA